MTTGSLDMVVAVVDTGVRYEHPDLLEVAVGSNLLAGYDMTSDPAAANDDGRDADASAAHAGDFDALLAVLDPDVVLRADRGALRVVRGARAVAEGAHRFLTACRARRHVVRRRRSIQ